MNPTRKCLNCDRVHRTKPYNSKSSNYCSACIPLTTEETQKMSRDYLPVSKGYISYDDTLPVYWGD